MSPLERWFFDVAVVEYEKELERFGETYRQMTTLLAQTVQLDDNQNNQSQGDD